MMNEYLFVKMIFYGAMAEKDSKYKVRDGINYQATGNGVHRWEW